MANLVAFLNFATGVLTWSGRYYIIIVTIALYREEIAQWYSIRLKSERYAVQTLESPRCALPFQTNSDILFNLIFIFFSEILIFNNVLIEVNEGELRGEIMRY